MSLGGVQVIFGVYEWTGGTRTLFDEYTEDVNPVLNANGMVK